MKYILSVITLMLFISGSFRAGAFELQNELEKKVSFDFDGMSLEKAIQNISAKINLELIPLDSITRNNRLNLEKIYLRVTDMPVEQLLDWFAGAIDAKYRIYPDGRVYLSQNYEWVEVNKFGMLFIDLKNVVSGTEQLDSLDKSLSELAKIITLFDDNYYVRIEEQADMVKLVAHTPKELKPVFLKLFEILNAPGEDIGGFDSGDNSQLLNFYNKLNTLKEIDYPYLPLKSILKRLEIDFGVNIGCSNMVYSQEDVMPEISLKIGKVSLKEAIETVIEKTSLKGAEISLPNGIWLTTYKANWQEAVARRFLWAENIVLRSYDINKISSIVPGKIIAKELVNTVAIRAWYDPLATVLFYEKSGNLIVLADNATQQRVLLALKDLRSRLGL